MPAVSQARARFMGAVRGGAIKKKGFSPAKAGEWLRGVKVSKLPERANGYSKLRPK